MLEASAILNASILIVDDQEANVMLLEQMLHNAGYTRITSTMDPRAVCALHRAQRFDLILLDLQMPEMDGFEVIEALKEIEADAYLPVLVITAQPNHKLRALQAGARDFVSKPFDLLEVQTRIRNMLEVRLLYQKLDHYNQQLEHTVLERTAALRESEARFQRFTELASDWYWEQDAEGRLTKHAGPVFEMLGIGADGARPALADTGTADNAAGRARLDAYIASRQPFLDFVYSRPDGHGGIQHLQVSGEPMFDRASRFIGYRGIGMDISARMVPNLEQLRFRAAGDAIAQGICLIERAGMRVVDVNAAACRLWGRDRRQLLNAAPPELGLGEGEALAALFAALSPQGQPQRQTLALRRADGSALAATVDWHILQQADAGLVCAIVSAD